MRNKKGFTLIELLVVIAIIALLVSILMPSLTKARELAKRAGCSMNMSAMGKGFAMYVGSSNQDQMPWVLSTNKWDSTAIAAVRTAPTGSQASALSTLPFMLIRDGQNAKLFNCPSDGTATECKTTKDTSQNYYWDFSAATDTSYAYAMPVTAGTGVINGVSTSSTGSVVIMADKLQSGVAYTGWATSLTGDQVKPYMSTNHSGGEYINFLRADYSVGHDTRPNCGMEIAVNGSPRDLIYTADGSAATAVPGSDTSTTMTLAAHNKLDDSFVFFK